MTVEHVKVNDLGKQRWDTGEGKIIDAFVTNFELRCPKCGKGGFEANCATNAELAEFSGNAASFRAYEDRAFMKSVLEGLSEKCDGPQGAHLA